MAVTVGLVGDIMLGRKVAGRIDSAGPRSLFATEVRDVLGEADLVLANLECCLSDRGARWPSPGKPFHFRAPPRAAEALAWLGITDVTLANNHALDYGVEALLDTRNHLEQAGIRVVGAGTSMAEAWTPIGVEVAGLSVAVLGLTDHPAEFAARKDAPGVAYIDLSRGLPPRLTTGIRRLRAQHDIVLVSPHWGPNMTVGPAPYIRSAARELVDAGATVVAGHSAHVFHGVSGRTLFDLGDFVDDYLVDRSLRNDLGLMWLLTLDRFGPMRLRAIPIALDFCHTRLADAAEYAWVRERFHAACDEFGTEVADYGDHLVVFWD